METLLFDLSSNFVIFVQIRGMDRVFKLNNQPKKKKDKTRLLMASFYGNILLCHSFMKQEDKIYSYSAILVKIKNIENWRNMAPIG